MQDLGSLRRELDLYDPTLSQRPWIIAANKMDLPEAEENLAILRSRFPDKIVVPMVAAEAIGMDELKGALRKLLAL